MATDLSPRRADLVDLGEALGAPKAGVLVRRISISPGNGGAARLPSTAACAVVLTGAVLRSVTLGRRSAALLHGPGDPFASAADEPLPFHARLRALMPSTVVLVDADVLLALGERPAVAGRIAGAVERQAGMLGLQFLLTQLVSVPDRLDVLLPILAERWGTVTGAGVVLPAFLSHTVLAELIGVRRPSFTTAFAAMPADGGMRRLDDGRWLLSPLRARLAA